ncbi:HesA/MoeB/ThiF family protein [Paracoccus xiamenensis]|uniref:HesA/MoeB/ThiF family protein n=1 Tax=Paracoccus xiamenensis TaxID=2714901 RepID=UPI001409FF4D|nr:HesA/MoeB/ThiF family protein [Paracoccus xiamenensis]NHF71801.1 HesA/MoeB/ThiF family protein [Paracoccus xiamenensis]
MALLPIAILSILGLAWWMGWGVLRVLVVIFIVWIVVLVLMLAAPAAEIRATTGFDARVWVIGGLVLGVTLAYGALVERARAAVKRRWGIEDAPGLAPAGRGAAGLAAGQGQGLAAGQGLGGDDALDRYARHIVLREIGGPGQAKLRDARVLLIGAGGLGAPAALYLAGAGVGRITLADPDTVSISNLQRQIIYRTGDAGRPKGLAAAEALRALNPLIEVHALRRRVNAADTALIAEHDLVLDGSDQFADRAAINAACVAAGVPLIAGSIAQWEGQLTTYDPAHGAPCMACIFPKAPAAGLAPACAEAGVAGPLPGIIGSMMALEAVKRIAGAGKGLAGQMLIFDGLYGETRRIAIHRNPDCPVCSGLEQRAPEA